MDLCRIKRENHVEFMQGVMEASFKGDDYSDVTLHCASETFRAHRMILASSSTYFKGCFDKVPQGHYPIVFFQDVPSNDMKNMLEFVYTGGTSISRTKLKGLIKLGDTLGIKELAELKDHPHYKTLLSDPPEITVKTSPPSSPNGHDLIEVSRANINNVPLPASPASSASANISPPAAQKKRGRPKNSTLNAGVKVIKTEPEEPKETRRGRQRGDTSDESSVVTNGNSTTGGSSPDEPSEGVQRRLRGRNTEQAKQKSASEGDELSTNSNDVDDSGVVEVDPPAAISQPEQEKSSVAPNKETTSNASVSSVSSVPADMETDSSESPSNNNSTAEQLVTPKVEPDLNQNGPAGAVGRRSLSRDSGQHSTVTRSDSSLSSSTGLSSTDPIALSSSDERASPIKVEQQAQQQHSAKDTGNFIPNGAPQQQPGGSGLGRPRSATTPSSQCLSPNTNGARVVKCKMRNNPPHIFNKFAIEQINRTLNNTAKRVVPPLSQEYRQKLLKDHEAAQLAQKNGKMGKPTGRGRGRPRKYGPAGGLPLATPTSSSSGNVLITATPNRNSTVVTSPSKAAKLPDPITPAMTSMAKAAAASVNGPPSVGGPIVNRIKPGSLNPSLFNQQRLSVLNQNFQKIARMSAKNANTAAGNGNNSSPAAAPSSSSSSSSPGALQKVPTLTIKTINRQPTVVKRGRGRPSNESLRLQRAHEQLLAAERAAAGETTNGGTSLLVRQSSSLSST